MVKQNTNSIEQRIRELIYELQTQDYSDFIKGDTDMIEFKSDYAAEIGLNFKHKKAFPKSPNGLYFAISVHSDENPLEYAPILQNYREIILIYLLRFFLNRFPNTSNFTVKSTQESDVEHTTFDIQISF